jgi:hypothetical protein
MTLSFFGVLATAKSAPACATYQPPNRYFQRPECNVLSRPDTESRRAMSMRERREAVEVMIKTVNLDILKGKYLPKSQVEFDAFNAARLTREKLQTIPDRVVPQLLGKTDVFEMKQILKKEIHDCLNELTDFVNGNG